MLSMFSLEFRDFFIVREQMKILWKMLGTTSYLFLFLHTFVCLMQTHLFNA